MDLNLDWATIVNAVIVGVLPVIVAFFRGLYPKLPRVVVWALPMIFGAALTAVMELVANAGPGSIKGLLLGALALVLRELVSTVKEHGLG